jgi:hypothetical protein
MQTDGHERNDVYRPLKSKPAAVARYLERQGWYQAPFTHRHTYHFVRDDLPGQSITLYDCSAKGRGPLAMSVVKMLERRAVR